MPTRSLSEETLKTQVLEKLLDLEESGSKLRMEALRETADSLAPEVLLRLAFVRAPRTRSPVGFCPHRARPKEERYYPIRYGPFRAPHQELTFPAFCR